MVSSIERQLIIRYALVLSLLIVICVGVIIYFSLDFIESLTLMLVAVGFVFWLLFQCYRLFTQAIENVSLQIESIANEENNINYLGKYTHGRLGDLSDIALSVASRIAGKRQEYLDNESFLFDLLSQLDMPTLVLDHHDFCYSSSHQLRRLINLDANQLYGQHASKIGLTKHKDTWQHAPSHLTQRHEIQGYTIKRGGRNYQLLVFFSIENKLRETEKVIWHRLIKVINHEVRNSLTPIYSLTQTLMEMKSNNDLAASQHHREGELLAVINQRSKHLLDFVNHYSAFSKLPSPNFNIINLKSFVDRLATIFPKLECICTENLNLCVDEGQLEQSLINIIKNAFEANEEQANNKGKSKVTLKCDKVSEDTVLIEIVDNGPGIGYSNNLFVPFYSTKTSGVGVGLVLARELIRNQGGDITLKNRVDSVGAVAKITLPASTATNVDSTRKESK